MDKIKNSPSMACDFLPFVVGQLKAPQVPFAVLYLFRTNVKTN